MLPPSAPADRVSTSAHAASPKSPRNSPGACDRASLRLLTSDATTKATWRLAVQSNDFAAIRAYTTPAQAPPTSRGARPQLPRTARADTEHIIHPDDHARIGSVKVGETRISLPGFTLPSIASIFVEDAAVPVGTDTDRTPLTRYLDREDLFTVLFSDFALAYIDGSLYRDEALLGGGADFLRHLQAAPPLAQATSEKGTFADGQQAFGDTSVFRAIVDHIARDADVLLCDDLGDEWADFIGISTVTRPPMVSFYHAKHGARSLSAAAFHDSVGQAIKNLGRMALPSEAMPAKYASWETPYRGAGAVTAIPRMIRGGGRLEIEHRIQEVRNAPDLLKRVFIVTSSLSQAQVEAAFSAAATGEPPSAHFVQLYWLLVS